MNESEQRHNNKEENSSSKTAWFGKRDLIDWSVILVIGAILYTTGLHTEVLGRLQQAVLWTGLIQPDIELPVSKQQPAGYDMDLISLDGEPVSLSTFKGKVIFLNYWATWCPPCIAEMPNIQALYEEYQQNEQIAFLMISLDEQVNKAREFVEQRNFSFPVYQLASSRPKSLQSTMLPTTFVIDKKGNIVVNKRGMANYNTTRFKNYLDSLVAED